jgi:glycosyltransferase involved in cell wall biosynthesis
VQSQREIVRLEVHRNQSLSREEIAGIISNELVFARDADQILTVSEREARIFTDFGFSQPTIVHHGVTPHPTTRSFTDRSHFLTVGPLLAPDTPNSDGVDWFMRAVHPQIVSSLQTSKVFLDCVGTCRVKSFEEQYSSGLRLLGQLANLYPAYNEHRVCIAPTRFSAGIPLKVIEAASYGVPSVVTPLLAEQLAWRDGVEILVGYDAKDFAAKCVALYSNQALWEDVRSAALARVQREYSVESCKKRLALVMQRYHRSSAGQRSENRRLPSDVQAGA